MWAVAGYLLLILFLGAVIALFVNKKETASKDKDQY